MAYYEIRAARTQQDVIDNQCDVIDARDTLVEAKQRARYLISDEFQAQCSITEPFCYAQVLLNGKICVADYLRKGKFDRQTNQV